VTPPEFIVAPGALDGLAAGAVFTLEGPEAHHAARVQRLGAGEPIDVVDGLGRRARGRVAQVEKADDGGPRLQIDVAETIDEPGAEPGIVLVQALAKGGRDERAVEAATGLGAQGIVPWAADRSVVKWPGAKAAKGRERWRAIVHAETKVARRSHLPEVAGLLDTAGLVRAIATGPFAHLAVLVLHEDAADHLSAQLAALGGNPCGSGAARPGTADEGTPERSARSGIVLVVGPEGGISGPELDRLCEAGGRACLLGRGVLRASAAGPAAIAALNALLGRW
jgi:16S rRNA (uracil1498-N3)-methyltransferase